MIVAHIKSFASVTFDDNTNPGEYNEDLPNVTVASIHPINTATIVDEEEQNIANELNNSMAEYIRIFNSIKLNDGTSYYGREILPNNSSMFSGYHANLWRNYPYYNSKIIQSKKFEFIGVARLFEGDTEIEAVAVLQIGSRPYIVNPILKTSKRTGLRPGFFRYGQYFNNANGPRKNITHFSWVKSNSADVPLVGSTEVFSKYEISKFPGASAVANNPPILPENGELSPYSVDREKILKDIMNLFEWKNLVRDDYSQYLKDTSKDLSYYMNQSEKEFESKIVKYNSNDFKQFVQERILALSELDTDIITYLNKFLNTGCLRKG